jgi:hypothetical protein
MKIHQKYSDEYGYTFFYSSKQDINFAFRKGLENRTINESAAMGIRTPVASVRGSHDWPDYTIAAQLLNNLRDIFT